MTAYLDLAAKNLFSLLRVHWVLVLSLLTTSPGHAVDPATENAWLAPLAAHSLLLDIARAGDRLVAVGERGHVLLSDDDGETWKQVQVPTRTMLTAVHFLDDKLGFAVGHDAVILRTEDGGSIWQRVHYAPQEERP